MPAAWIGLCGVVFAAILGYVGARRMGRAQQQTADVNTLRLLMEELRAERDDARRLLAECQRRLLGGGPS